MKLFPEAGGSSCMVFLGSSLTTLHGIGPHTGSLSSDVAGLDEAAAPPAAGLAGAAPPAGAAAPPAAGLAGAAPPGAGFAGAAPPAGFAGAAPPAGAPPAAGADAPPLAPAIPP